MEKSKKQPKRKSGFTFISWAVFNWGISHDRTFRTRKEAQDYCCEIGWTSTFGETKPTWSQVKGYMQVAKVECKII